MSELPVAETIIPPGAAWTADFDVAHATDAYVAVIPTAERAKSDAYFEGGYWIEAWGTVITVLIAWLLLSTRFSAGLRDFAGRRTRRANLQALLYALAYLLLVAVLTLPWSLYTEYFREHAYGMSNYTLGGFLKEWVIGTAVNAAIGGVAITGLYAILRRVGRRWVLWATGAAGVFMLFLMMIAPVFIAPLFNDYQPLDDGPVRDSILALAEQSGIPVDDVYWFDASKQTKRISANVAGLFGTMRIALNDNLLNGTSLAEIRAVMAHEMGHYALHHGPWLALGFTVVFGIGFWVVDRLFAGILATRGASWGVRGLADPAGLPLIVAIFAVVLYVATPVTNNFIRLAEHQADAFGLDQAREPYGFASAALRISNYRKLEPSALEESVFFDHPSGRTRIDRAMRWLAEHPPAVVPEPEPAEPAAETIEPAEPSEAVQL